jgi:hypothetical protein
MACLDIDYCFVNPTLFDFKADTLRKAIVKLHRLNASSHSSPDDWHLNMIEATKDLTNGDEQTKFYQYLSNPSGFTENKELWDALEKFDREHADPQIVKECTGDPFDESLFTTESRQIGTTQYIYITNNQNTTEPVLGSIEEEDDEKIPIAD